MRQIFQIMSLQHELSFHRCGHRRWYVDKPGIGPTAAVISASVVVVCGEIEVVESRGSG
jgi:hypothetical protein